MKINKYILASAFLFLANAGYSQAIRKVKIRDLQRVITSSRTPMIVNFWATFCVPCIEEIPHFQKVVKEHEKEGVELLLVSLDMEADYVKVGPFAKKRKFTAPIWWLDETNADYFIPRIDSTWSGAIPATLFINNKTGYRKFVEEQVKEAELRAIVDELIK